MKTDIFKGQWPQIRSGLKANWDKITDDDLNATGMNEQEFLTVLEKRYGYSPDTAKREFSEFMKQQVKEKKARRDQSGLRSDREGPRSIKDRVKQEQTPVAGQRLKKVQRIGP